MRTLAIFILVFLGIHLLKAEGGDFQWYSYAGTNQYCFLVTRAEIAKAPIWTESSDQPPLSARKALRIARACLAKLVTNSEHWRVDSLSLYPLDDAGHWVYLVSFDFVPPASASGSVEHIKQPMTIPVLMNGVAIAPKIK